MLGSSGVGKTSLINRLLGTDELRVGPVREKDSRGRHVTTSRHLLVVSGGGLIMDTPGLREIQMWAHEDGLEGAFQDIEMLAAECRFRDCQHRSEPGCAVKEAIERGEIDEKRLRSYLKLQREIRFLAIRKDQRARMDERSKWKKIAISSRQRRKHGWKP
jgi:ribosome biogenesis GTPase